MSKNNILHIISNETKSSIDQMAVVTPSIYASIFTKYADEHDELIEDEHNLAVDILKQECSTLTHMQDDTSKNANILTKNTHKAIAAIKEKDEKGLAEVLKETQKLKAEIEKLKEAVYRDELTRAYNRKWLHDNYLREDSTSLKEAGTLAIIDLNYFKQINDIHGHIIGDKVLIYIANQLKSTRANVVRYGGDEFILLFEAKNSIKYAINTIETIREDVISKKLKAHDSKFTVSFSYGLVSFASGNDLAQTIELADKNMYEDKIKSKKELPESSTKQINTSF